MGIRFSFLSVLYATYCPIFLSLFYLSITYFFLPVAIFVSSRLLLSQKNTHPPLLTFSCIAGNNKPFRLLITLLCFGNATLMIFSASGDTPKINYTLLFNTSIPSTPTLKLALLTICIPLIFWIAMSIKITPNFQQKFFFKPIDTQTFTS